MTPIADNDRSMATARCAVRAGIAFLLVALTGAPAASQTAESWQVLLRAQLQDRQRCELRDFLTVREVPVGGKTGLEGRIRCTDGREFDFSRDEPNALFTIRLCQPAVC